MDFYEEASLVMVPSGYKDQKVYSSVPDDGSADLTFSRASNATRVNSEGLVEKVRTNLLLQSNQFDTTWTTVNTSVTGGQTGYDDSSDAWKLEATSASGSLFQYNTTSGVSSFSIYAKAGNVSWVRLRYDNSPSPDITTWFNLSDGSIGTDNGIAPYTENVGNGWWRVVVQANTSDLNNVRIYPASSDGNNANTGEYIYIQDAQLNYGLVAQDYVETTTAAVTEGIAIDVPRLNYDPVNPTSASLLLEPSRTNYFPHSEYLASYAVNRGSVSSNVTTSPEGVVNASELVPTTDNGDHTIQALIDLGNVTNTFSIFAKRNGVDISLSFAGSSSSWTGCIFDLANGIAKTPQNAGAQSVCTASIEPYGNDWYKCSITATPYASGNFYVFVSLANNVDGSLSIWGRQSFVGVPSQTAYLYGGDLQRGSYPTSYIPTYGTSATRVAEVSYKTGISSLIGQTEGTLFFDIQDTEHFISYFGVDNVSTSTRILVYGVDDQKVYAQVRNGGTIVFSAQSAAISGRAKAAVSFNASGSVFYVNGTQVGSGSGTTYTNLSQFTLNHASQVGAKVSQALLFTSRLSNADLATLTTL